MSIQLDGSLGITFPDGSIMASAQQAARAWVNFNGSGTIAIRASYNVSSLTDNGVGNYTINFTNALADVNYAAIGNHNGVNAGVANVVFALDAPALYSTTQLSLTCFNGDAAASNRVDATRVAVAVFR